MSLATGKPALKAALLNIANNTDDSKTQSESIDEFLDLLETWVSSANVTIPAGFVSQGVSPSVIVNPAPIIIPNGLS